jgi:hypothetical protein
VACPYFLPLERREERLAFRLPLGAFWTGECGAGPRETPADEFQLNECNFGYVRGRCPRFPPDAEADAVRFTRRNGERLFILEKDHAPVRFGPIAAIERGTILEKQARAWIGI